jgi:hypothetical protein
MDEMNELDKLRARIAKLKNWKFWEIDVDQGYSCLQYAMPDGEIPEPAGYGYKVHEIEMPTTFMAFDDDDPDWPRSIADAWELWDEMKNTGVIRLSNGDGDSCDIDYLPFDLVHQPIHISAENDPEVISRAYLIWQESQQQEAQP